MSRYRRDPWAKKAKRGQKSLNTMLNLAFGLASVAVSAASSSSTTSRRRSSSHVSQVRRQMAAAERERVAAEKRLGLSQYVASTIFNVSPKIEKVEVTGYTQRLDTKSSLITDQYVLVVSFDRPTFAKIDFETLSALQIMNFFKHYMNMSKAFVFKELDLDFALAKMEQCEVVNYENYMTNYHVEKK